MSRRRWVADEVSGDDRAALVGAHAAHLARVLRARVGQHFDIAANGCVRDGRIVSVAEDRVEFVLGAEVSARAVCETTLLLAVFKFDRMEWAIEKCTELGAARIVPVIAARTDTHLAKAAAKRVERWRRIAREASEQARRAAPPEIVSPIKLGRATLDSISCPTRIVLAETEQGVTLAEVLREQETGLIKASPSASLRSPQDDSIVGASAGIALAVGPEGGWTADELQLFAASGWRSASLGNLILRAETATIASLAVVMAEI
ncbi:MAG: 16S rRNA (uracil(1498)-N(3))-methyltransferase [Terriglobales bacterium]